jgi:AcrR family transcriptional regulator
MPRAGLNRDAVTALALEVLDEGGPEALTLRSVAARAGVASPSLYKHVQNLEHLRDLVTVAVLEEAAGEIGSAVMGRSGREALASFLSTYRGYAQRKPYRWALMEHPSAEDPAVAAAAGRLVDIAYAVVRGFGLSEAEQVDAVRTLRAAVTGFIGLEQGGGFRIARDLDTSFQFLVKVLADGLVSS